MNWNNESVSQFGPRNLMIKRDHVKYQFYGPDSPEVLFDLERDAGETRNFINEPQYAAAIASFRERLGELGHGPNADRDYLHAGYDASKQELS